MKTVNVTITIFTDVCVFLSLFKNIILNLHVLRLHTHYVL